MLCVYIAGSLPPFLVFRLPFPTPAHTTDTPAMNKHRHKTVFNRTRGILMAVAETAIGQGKSPGERSGGETGGGDGSLKTHSGRDLCKKALPSTTETQTQVFGCFSPPIPPDFTQMPP